MPTVKRHTPTHSRRFWVAVIATANALQLSLLIYAVLNNATIENNPAIIRLTIGLAVIACIGPFWMLAHWFIKRAKKLRWQRWMWLFFVPWGFLWYVFEKYEPPESDLLRTGR